MAPTSGKDVLLKQIPYKVRPVLNCRVFSRLTKAFNSSKMNHYLTQELLLEANGCRPHREQRFPYLVRISIDEY